MTTVLTRRKARRKPAAGGAAGGARTGNGKPATEHREPKTDSHEPPTAELLPWPGERLGSAEQVELRLEEIVPSPYQPRMEFPEAELRELADSIEQLGQVVPVQVRRRPTADGKRTACYELLDGERRWRAAKLAGLASLRAEVQQRTDAEARGIVIASAVHRKALNAIEEARAYRAMLAAGDCATQEQLAAALGVTQGQVSNRLRLLELPEALQKRIISGEMPATHGRYLARYAGVPGLLPVIDRQLREQAKGQSWREPIVTEEHLAAACEDIVADWSRPMTGPGNYDYRLVGTKHKGRPPVFTPGDAQRAKLGIVEVPTPDGKTEPRATNVKLWQKLQDEHVARLVAEASARREKKGEQKAAKGAKAKDLSPAEKRRVAAEEKRKAERREREHAERLARFRADWQRCLIARAIREGDRADVLRCLLAALGCWPTGDYRHHAETAWLDEAIDEALAKGRAKHLHGGQRLWWFQDDEIDQLAARTAAAFFRGEDGAPSSLVEAEDVAEIAAALGVDLEAEWLEDQAGELSQAYWELHTKDQLAELAAELKVELPRGAGKAEMVAALLARRPGPDDREVGLPMPKELRAVGKHGRKQRR